jgi:FkbM family methyltransferase
LFKGQILSFVKQRILGSPFEGPARRAYIRLDPSPGGRYDRQTLAIMRRGLQRDSTCIDIGAHRGAILREILAAAPQGKHLAFEPLAEHARYLQQTFPNVKVYCLALSHVRGHTSFTRVVMHPTRSSFKNTVPGEQVETIQVETDCLDNLVPAGLPVRFIKLDVEGAEHQVLQGAMQTLRRWRPLLVFEHSQLAQTHFNTSPEMVYDLLSGECGMKVSLLGEWLAERPPLERVQFIEEVLQGKNFYFLAH